MVELCWERKLFGWRTCRLGPKCLKVWSSQQSQYFSGGLCVDKPLKVTSDATIQLPELVSETRTNHQKELSWLRLVGLRFLDLSSWGCLSNIVSPTFVWRMWQSSNKLLTILSELLLPALDVWNHTARNECLLLLQLGQNV